MKVITLLNQKGGAGKTTIAIQVAAYLTNIGKRVLLIDADFTQESALTWAAVSNGRYFEVVVQEAKQIANTVKRNTDIYDFIIIDSPPRANDDTAKFILVSDLILIPIQPSPYDIWACNDVISAIQQRQELTKIRADSPEGGTPIAAFVLSRATKGTRLMGETADVLADTGFPTLKGMTTQYETYKRSAMTGHTIFDCPEPNQNAIEQITQIATEALELLA